MRTYAGWVLCSACGSENPEGNRFCGGCGASLVVEMRARGEERKVVTALFSDLVGFTALSESADPEDITQMLTAYYGMARAAIESFGGVVEKFIGDAVVGVFGVPAAHEDDPERAVRAALRIAEDAERLTAAGGGPLLLRVGVNTGEALVRLGVTPGSGEGFLAGDAINAASRIQSIAPEMGVAVGQATFEATAAVFDYEELPAATVKGKAEPVAVFHARASRARFGTDITRVHNTPFVGREIDLALLKAIFDKTVAAGMVQLVTVVGEPGLGKSRIVAELFHHVDARPELVTWRQGRCLPYGEGITFWALGEIVKAHAGILESDPPAVASAKLDAVLPVTEERAWFRQRLLPLLGIGAASTAERGELFTAWRRFLEHLAEAAPTVVVFEDLHWADEAMLAFIEHLADHAQAVPLLVVATARPELFEHHPDYAAGLRNATPILLAPLSEAETARLVSALLDTTVLPAELQRPILDRADGNPLYAEEFVRLLKDRDLLTPKGSSWELKDGEQVPFPDSVQALIAARLDTLAPDAKSLLADAAVVGKVFWAGAVAAMSGREVSEVVDELRKLSRKELVRPSRRSSMAEEAEYAFWHVLTRDVAYGQLPRASRAARHVAAAQWIESKAPERVEDLADVLAFHYATALELAQAAGDADQVARLQASALRFLTLAGDRALGLDTAAALASFQRALDVTPPGHPARAETLARFGVAAYHAGRHVAAEEALQEAVELFRGRGDVRATARTLGMLTAVLFTRGDGRRTQLPAEAVALLEPLPPGPELVEALTEQAALEAIQSWNELALLHADRALDLAGQLGLGRPARALGFRAAARTSLGDASGLEDFRDAIVLATDAGQGREVALLHNNLAEAVEKFDGPVASLDVMYAGLAFAKARGITGIAESMTASTLIGLIQIGQFDQALTLAADLLPRLEASGARGSQVEVRAAQTRIQIWQGSARAAVDSLDWLVTTARGTADPQLIAAGVGTAALAYADLGDANAVGALLSEIATPEAATTGQFAALLPAWVRAAVFVGQLGVAERLIAAVEPRGRYSEHSLVAASAALSEARHDLTEAVDTYIDAARRWHDFGVVPEEGFALFGQGRCLVALGRNAEAVPVLHQARDIFQRLGAEPAVTETDALLVKATALSS
jgi:class 3 adenylate cyclase/tetratricopeptide (TPR) repeat protein